MKLELICAWRNLLRLLRFLVLYAGVVAILFYLLPLAASFLQTAYESMTGAVKAAGLALFILAITAWQIRSWRRERTEADLLPSDD